MRFAIGQMDIWEIITLHCEVADGSSHTGETETIVRLCLQESFRFSLQHCQQVYQLQLHPDTKKLGFLPKNNSVLCLLQCSMWCVAPPLLTD